MPSISALPIPSGHPSSVVDALKSVWVDYQREATKRRKAQAAIDELNRLDDGALADMGVYRGQIEDMVLRGRRAASR